MTGDEREGARLQGLLDTTGDRERGGVTVGEGNAIALHVGCIVHVYPIIDVGQATW